MYVTVLNKYLQAKPNQWYFEDTITILEGVQVV